MTLKDLSDLCREYAKRIPGRPGAAKDFEEVATAIDQGHMDAVVKLARALHECNPMMRQRFFEAFELKEK